MKKVLVGTALAGLLVFVWGSVSWMVLDWHHQTHGTFSDEAAVAETIVSNTTDNGVYILPNMSPKSQEVDPETAAADEADFKVRMLQGPFVFVALRKEGTDPNMVLALVATLGIQLLAALIIAWLLSQTSGLGYIRRVFFVTTIGLVTGVLAHLPNWVWWQFGMDYTLVQMADLVIGWFIGGVIIAAFVGRKPKISKETSNDDSEVAVDQ